MKIRNDDVKLPRCYFSHCTIPKYTDQARPPTKQQPFKSFIQHAPLHTVDLILPEEIYTLVQAKLEEKTWRYARVYMSLLDIISDNFFNQYVKAGNIIMISEGQRGIHNTFKVKDGVLHLDVDKATYERCGLVGEAAASQGRKHVTSRYRVSLDLKLNSMQHGKKGFERVKWAFKNVLNDSLAWLFVDLENEDILSGPVSALHPHILNLKPTLSRAGKVVPPFVKLEEAIHDELYEEQLLEWLGLLALESPRLTKAGKIDSYLCKYSLPEAFNALGKGAPREEVLHLRWHGFASTMFARHIWLILRAATTGKKNTWFSLSGKTFEGTAFTTLCNDGQKVMLWECD